MVPPDVSVSEKYSDRKRTAEAAEGFDRLVQDGMARKFDAVVVDSIFRCGRTLPFAIEALQRTFYPLGIQFAVVEDDFCSADKTAEEVAEYFNGKAIDKIRSEFITNRQNHFEEGTLTHRQAKYGYSLSEDRRNLVLNPESAQVVKLIFQMYLEDMKIPEIARALDAQGVPSPQIQMAKKKRSRAKIKWPDSTIRSILKNPLYIGKCTLTLAKAKRELEVPAIVSKTECTTEYRKVFAILREYLLDYWEHYDYMIDYLFLDYLIVLARKQNDYVNQAFNEIIPNNKNCDELLKVLGTTFDSSAWEMLKDNTALFKLTWKADFPQIVDGGIGGRTGFVQFLRGRKAVLLIGGNGSCHLL